MIFSSNRVNFSFYSALVAIFSGNVALSAAPTGLSTPTGFVLPNYDRVPVGQKEALEGGAFVARTSDALANWYNPAGLSQSSTSAITASANAYEWISLSADALGANANSSNVNQLSTFFGAVIAEPLFKNDRMRAGFAITKPTIWKLDIDNLLENSNGGNSERLNYASQISYAEVVPTLSLGYAYGGPFRFGVSAGLDFINFSQNIESSDQYISSGNAQNYIRNFRTDGTSRNLLLSAGAQWEASEKIRVGTLIVAPGISLGGGTSLTYEAMTYSAGETTNVFFRDTNARFRNEVPLQVRAGIAYLFSKRSSIEFDVKFHSSVGSYQFITSGAPGTVTATTSLGASTTSSVPFPSIDYSTRAVVNGAIGGHYQLSSLLDLHAGIFSAASPVKEVVGSPFRKVDLYGGTLGVSFGSSHLSGSVGAAYQLGSSEAHNVTDLLSGETVSTSLDVHTFSALYAISYKF